MRVTAYVQQCKCPKTKQHWYISINNLTTIPSIEFNSKILIGATRIVACSQDNATSCVPLPYKV